MANFQKIAVAVVVLIYFATGIYAVKSDETAVVTRFGRIVGERVPPGIQYRLPWPFEKTYKLKTTTVYKMGVGFKITEEVQGISPRPQEKQWLTGDVNIIELNTVVHFTIADAAKFLFVTDTPQYLIKKVAEASLTEVVGVTPVDEVFTTARVRIQEEVKRSLQEGLDSYGVGIRISSVNLKTAEPPPEVIRAFQDVVNAKADRERLINNANGYANEILPGARGEAEKRVQAAEAERGRRVANARGEGERFLNILAEYSKAPEVTRRRLYLETAEKVLPKLNKYFFQTGGGEFDLKIIQEGK
jgi:membrane protease subunit HflK